MRTFLTAIFLLFYSTVVLAQTVSPRLHAALQTAGPGEKIPVIIELSGQANLRSFAARGRVARQLSPHEKREQRSALIRTLKSRADLAQEGVRAFLRSNGIATQKTLWINNSIAVSIRPDLIQQLANMPEVASIRTDAVVSLPKIVPAATGGVEDNLVTIKVPDLWALGIKGQGTVIALLDTGVDYLHSDLNSSWRGGGNSWFNPVAADCALDPSSCTACDSSADLPCDFVNSDGIAHGTGVAGLLVGGDAGGTTIGAAPQAQWIAAKVFKSTGTAKTSNIHLAFQWALDPDGDPNTDDAPDVVNVSWVLDSPGTCIAEFRTDVQALQAAGIASVFAAGNSGPAAGSDDSPANYPESLSVGSIGNHTSTLGISDFSGRGPSSCDGTIYPKLVAPGFGVKTADYTYGGTQPDNYATLLAGTSFSAPQVAGILALLTQAFPQASLSDREDALTASAQDLGSAGPDNDYGYGLVNAAAAYDWLQAATNVPANTPPPAPILISPASGASGLALPVEVSWRQLPDPDGNQVSNRLYISTDSAFSGTSPIVIAAHQREAKLLTAGIGGLLVAGLLIRKRRGSSHLWMLLLVTALAILTSCGGGGGGSSGTDSTLHSYSLTGLASQTTYFWKVSADDGQGGTVESSVASFTTK